MYAHFLKNIFRKLTYWERRCNFNFIFKNAKRIISQYVRSCI